MSQPGTFLARAAYIDTWLYPLHDPVVHACRSLDPSWRGKNIFCPTLNVTLKPPYDVKSLQGESKAKMVVQRVVRVIGACMVVQRVVRPQCLPYAQACDLS